MSAIPGVVVMVIGVLVIIVLRSVMGSGSSVARSVLLDRASTEAERRSDSLLPLLLGIGLVVAGFWLGVYGLIKA